MPSLEERESAGSPCFISCCYSQFDAYKRKARSPEFKPAESAQLGSTTQPLCLGIVSSVVVLKAL